MTGSATPLPLNAFAGLIGESGMPSGPPPLNRTPKAVIARIEISVSSRTASTFAATLMSKYARIALRISIAPAKTSQGRSIPNCELNVLSANAEKIPTSAASIDMYAVSMSRPAAMPTGRPMPCETNP